MKTRAFLFASLAMLTSCGGGPGTDGSTADVSTSQLPAITGKPPATANSNPFLFVATGDTATAYKIDPQTGVLIASGTPVARRLGPYSIAVDPRGKFAYVDTSLCTGLQHRCRHGLLDC
jgi:DNA-binding beta-propeller fold protein YncE